MTVETRTEGATLVVGLSGSIDSLTSPQMEETIRNAIDRYDPEAVTLDCDKLEYITSAGLRVILRLKQRFGNLRLINVHNEVYGVLSLTGFTELMTVEKAYRVFSVYGCEAIGHGANGKVYRIDADTIVKVYRNPDALPEIRRERELARAAFVAGIPTAIPYDVVRIEGGGYGSVFELLNATSFAELLIRHEKTVGEMAAMSIDLLKLIHSKTIRSDVLPSMKETVLGWMEFLRGLLTERQFDRLRALVAAVPDDEHVVHGDFHLKNIMLQNNEALLIDMDTLSHGNPVFELACMYNAYHGFGCTDHEETRRFLGIDWDTATAFWRKSLSLYLNTEDEETLRAAENKIMIVSSIRIIHHYIRHGGLENAVSCATIEHWKAVLNDLLPTTETILL